MSTPYKLQLYKRCRCAATASGPRLIFRDPKMIYGDTESVAVECAILACDQCDTPWSDAPTHDGMPHLKGGAE